MCMDHTYWFRGDPCRPKRPLDWGPFGPTLRAGLSAITKRTSQKGRDMKVLYATDGFEAASAARRLILETFRPTGTLVTVVSVTHSWSLDPGHVMLQLDPIEQRRDDSKQLVEFAEAELREAGFETEGLMLEGQPGKKLLQELRTGDYDVAVVGSGSHSWAGHRLLGSVSTLILHEAPCSVVITHEFADTNDVRQTLVCVDGSETSDRTVRATSRVLDPKRIQVEVLSVAHAILPVAVPVLMGPTYPSPGSADRIEHLEKERARRNATTSARQLQEAGFQVSSRVESGGPATVILEEARREKIDMVIVGCRGLGPVRRVLLGSVSDQIARHASAAFVGRFA